ncbi:hypothetical protein MRX96_032164 [Rhipicephalus microplus]
MPPARIALTGLVAEQSFSRCGEEGVSGRNYFSAGNCRVRAALENGARFSRLYTSERRDTAVSRRKCRPEPLGGGFCRAANEHYALQPRLGTELRTGHEELMVRTACPPIPARF